MQALPYQNLPNYRQVPSHCIIKKKPSSIFNTLVEREAQLFERLKLAGLIQTIDLENINVKSNLYTPDLHCSYCSRGFGHITKDYMNLKHRFKTLKIKKVVTPNVNSNLIPNYGGMTKNVIKVEEDSYIEKVIISTNIEKIEQVLVHPIKKKKFKFVIMIPHQAFAWVPKEGQNKNEIDQAFPKSLPHSY